LLLRVLIHLLDALFSSIEKWFLYTNQLECTTLNPTNYHSKSWSTSTNKTTNRAGLSEIVAALIHEHTHIATESATTQNAVWQIRNSILYPRRMKRHKHAKLLGIIVHHVQQSKDTINLYKVKAHAGILGNECAVATAKCSAENESVHDIQINTDAHPHSSISGQQGW